MLRSIWRVHNNPNEPDRWEVEIRLGFLFYCEWRPSLTSQRGSWLVPEHRWSELLGTNWPLRRVDDGQLVPATASVCGCNPVILDCRRSIRNLLHQNPAVVVEAVVERKADRTASKGDDDDGPLVDKARDAQLLSTAKVVPFERRRQRACQLPRWPLPNREVPGILIRIIRRVK